VKIKKIKLEDAKSDEEDDLFDLLKRDEVVDTSTTH